MYLARPVIDTKGAQLAKQLLDDRVPSDSGATDDLNTAVGNPKQALGHSSLRHGGLDRPQCAAVQHARARVDHQLGLFELDLIVGEHEADALMIDQQLAKRP